MSDYSEGYFDVEPTEEFWLEAGDLLGFSGTGIAFRLVVCTGNVQITLLFPSQQHFKQ